ncbi:MAG: OmpA family protein [Planctomycetota bacterium]
MRSFSIARSLILVSSLSLLGGCATQQELDSALVETDNLREQLAEARAELARRQARIEDLEIRLENLTRQTSTDRADWLVEAREIADRLAQGGLPDGVSGRQTDEGFVFDVEGTLLFPTGSEEISAAGKNTLRQLAGRIQAEGRPVRVDGHTDSQPISRQGRYKSNLDLSAARAVAVAEFLVESGVSANRVSIAGFGEHDPKTSNDTPEGMANNRRTEILIKKDS